MRREGEHGEEKKDGMEENLWMWRNNSSGGRKLREWKQRGRERGSRERACDWKSSNSRSHHSGDTSSWSCVKEGERKPDFLFFFSPIITNGCQSFFFLLPSPFLWHLKRRKKTGRKDRKEKGRTFEWQNRVFRERERENSNEYLGGKERIRGRERWSEGVDCVSGKDGK